ncbi:hypothetical protein L9F63_003713, partial [Diploptera punctata]
FLLNHNIWADYQMLMFVKFNKSCKHVDCYLSVFICFFSRENISLILNRHYDYRIFVGISINSCSLV